MNTASRPPKDRIRFSIIVAVYNVAPYLKDFIASVDDQSFDLTQVEVIMVDDGSTDESAEILKEWQSRRPHLVTVLTKSNGGQASARNLGLSVASGEWVTFPDPDDMLAENYLSTVAHYLEKHLAVDMVGTKRLMLSDKTGLITDSHPLRNHFGDRNRLVALDLFPRFFHGHAPSAFFKLERILELGLEFDSRIRPNFEDGHFCVVYLLGSPESSVGFIQSTHYIYRKRADQSSATQTSTTHPGHFTDVLEYGYLDVLKKAHDKGEHVPFWLQNYVLYELYWYLKAEDAHTNSLTAATGSVANRFHELMPQVLEYLEPEVVSSFRVRPFKSIWRDILSHSWNPDPWHTPYAVISKFDIDQKLARVVYRYVGPPPEEEFRIGEFPAEPQHAKHRGVRMFDRTLIHERIAWLPTHGPLSLRLDGRLVEFLSEWPGAAVSYARRPKIRRLLAENVTDVSLPSPETAGPVSKEERRFLRTKNRFLRKASSKRMTTRFQDAWVLMDRVDDADDSAEHVFRYLRERRSEINAWFVLEPDTPDWNRLSQAGYGKRLIPYGSESWKILMANCKVLISSHADAVITNPTALTQLFEPNWRFVFLQHGVTKDDISNWLNPKDIDLFVTSTPNELASVAGDETAYSYTTKEAKLTELPRFDLVLEKGRQYPPEKRDLVLIAPTWRDWLTVPPEPGSRTRTVTEGFQETTFWRNWLGLLESEPLAKAAAARNLQVAFLPHPELQSILTSIQLPEHVLPLSFAGQDVRSLFARSAVFITDYSSMAFNTAYIERPVVYFQFDQDEVFGGAHLGRKGYFDYNEQGFGPVATDLPAAVEATVDTLRNGPEPSEIYLQRIQATFPHRDGHARERVIAEIENLFAPSSVEIVATPIPEPTPV